MPSLVCGAHGLIGSIVVAVLYHATDGARDIGSFVSWLLAGIVGISFDVLILMDETEPLKHEVAGGEIHRDRPGTDPDDARVPAAQQFVEQLLIKQQDEGFATNVRVAGFGQLYNAAPGAGGTYGGWTALNESSLSKINSVIAAQADRDSELYTNYANAFAGAYEDFSRSEQPDACKMLVTFTDGALTAEGPASADVEAKDAICRPGGLADQIRSAGIYHVGIGLSQSNAPTDFSLFKGVTSGEGERCGELPAFGAFYPANSAGSLFASFRQALGTPGAASGERVASESFDVMLDDSIDAVRFTVIARDDLGPDAHVVLTAPDGSTVDLLGDGETQLGGANVQWSAVQQPVQQVDGTMQLQPGQSWEGLWKLSFTDFAADQADGRVFNTVRIQPDSHLQVTSIAAQQPQRQR
ncbi:hypothetical protein ACFPVT_09525 [Corynebacterium choanae]|uniref:hypothetical protein n=1 Tax=Corynebacterium choanae TaxID=1862358 RepID=UPI000F500B35|nr:hypothetical protein [Corynebacterium choanae]